MFTYGDGVADVNLRNLMEFHQSHGKLATVTTVRSPARFGRINFDGDRIVRFYEKPQAAEGWINGGYFLFKREIFDHMKDGEELVYEPFRRLIAKKQLTAYEYKGFWQSMDTLKDKQILEELYARGEAPWTVWASNDRD